MMRTTPSHTGLLDSLHESLYWAFHHIWNFTDYDKVQPDEQTEERRPESMMRFSINEGNENDDEEAEHVDRPFTVEFLKKAARESADVEEFLSSLFVYKEASP